MNEYQNLMQDDQLAEAADWLLERASNNNQKNDLILLKGRLSRLERDIRLGVMQVADAGVERARIRHALSELGEQFDVSSFPPSTKKSSISDNERDSNNKKRILFICSSPNKQKALNFGGELKRIEDARMISDGRDNFEEIEIETGVRFDRLPKLLKKYNPNILHISLHASKTKGLYFEDRGGNEDPVAVQDFVDIIDLYNSSGEPIETLILSACNSFAHAEGVKNICKNVIGMKDFFPDDAAVIYAEHFYENIFDGNDIGYAHKAATLSLKRKRDRYETLNLAHEVDSIPVLLSKK